MFKSVFKNKEIEFLCAKEDYGIIPTPFPSSKIIPDWFKALPSHTGDTKSFDSATIKRCSPFLDTMLAGYIIPLAADVHFKTDGNATGIHYEWRFHKPMVENHLPEQVSSPKCPNTFVGAKPPMKFMNYWFIKTPPDYSLLFVQPLNRPESRFTLFSGIVDHPYYELEYVNFPFVFNTPNFDDIIPAGTPLMQVIPFKKNHMLNSYRSRPVNEKEEASTNILRNIREKVHRSLYRDKMHKRINE